MNRIASSSLLFLSIDRHTQHIKKCHVCRSKLAATWTAWCPTRVHGTIAGHEVMSRWQQVLVCESSSAKISHAHRTWSDAMLSSMHLFLGSCIHCIVLSAAAQQVTKRWRSPLLYLHLSQRHQPLHPHPTHAVHKTRRHSRQLVVNPLNNSSQTLPLQQLLLLQCSSQTHNQPLPPKP